MSVLISRGEALLRLNFAIGEWKGPPEGAIGWWRCRMPETTRVKLRPAPAGVLLDMLTELLSDSTQAQLAYVLALVLVRRRIVTDGQQSERNVWQVTSPVDGRTWSVPIALPTTTDEAQQLQHRLMDLLFTEE